MRRWTVLALALATLDCNGTGLGQPGADGPTHDLAVSDAAAPGDGGLDADLATTPPDLTAAPPDLTAAPPDLTAAPPDLTAAPPDLTVAPPDLTSAPPDLTVLKAWGSDCVSDNECASQLCKPVVAGGSNVCVTTCVSQASCAGLVNVLCEATAAGVASGYCIPRSPSHCASCSLDSDCGSLAERCIQAAGDNARACHVDCALAGAAACPSDYSCGSVTDGATTRMLCLPNGGVCVDAVGGFCDRVNLPQPCNRTNASGTCNGQRTCMAGSFRYNSCSATQPQAKQSCAAMDPAGCALVFAASACMPPAGGMAQCSGGVCTEQCPVSRSVCGGGATGGGTCVDLQSDLANCGVCGRACTAPGAMCIAGGCV